MYLRRHHIQNVKLLRDVMIDFVDANGEPRMWTVFVGENRLCKTTLLQTIAAAAYGVDRGTNLATGTVASWTDLRNPVALMIESKFGFSEDRHHIRTYPGLPRSPVCEPPILTSTLMLGPNRSIFAGGSRLHGPAGASVNADPLTEVRSTWTPDWFVAAYGTSRHLPAGNKAMPEPIDRMRPLFGGDLTSTNFVDRFDAELGRHFAKVLQSVFIGGGLLPHISQLELRGRGGIRSSKDLIDAERFEMDIRGNDGKRIRIPAAWLSQGYQSLIAWVADFVGHILLEHGVLIEAADMEGIVLVDELDLHLHPTWQVKLIPALKAVFPRLQFIATTHSPMLLPALAAEEVILLSQDAEGSVVATPSAQSPALMTGSELYGAFFDIRKLYPEELGEKLHQYGYLATDPTRTEEEDARMHQLAAELTAGGVALDSAPVAREPGA